MKKNHLKKFTALLICSVILFSILSCSKKEKQLTILFSFEELTSEFWVAAHTIITENLKNDGIKVIEKNSNNDANRQFEQVKTALTQGLDGIIIIPEDGGSVATIIKEANKAEVPIVVFNRPPANKDLDAMVVVADNASIAEQSTQYMVEQVKKLGRKVTPAILVGDLGDPNAVERRKGYLKVVNANKDLFTRDVIEIPTKWDGNLVAANLKNAMQANPEIDFLFTSSDFMHPIVQSVLEPLGKWAKAGDPNHIIYGSIDGDQGACALIESGYLDATGVQNLFVEADLALTNIKKAIADKEKMPKRWLYDKGFALTIDNFDERKNEMWGCAYR